MAAGMATSASESRRRQLRLVKDPESRDEFIVDELNEVERTLDELRVAHESRFASELEAFKNALRTELDTLWRDLKERDDKTNKRITTMQGMLIGTMASTTAAAIVGLMNIAFR